MHALSPDQLRVLANPLRESILGMLCRETLSATRIAERMPDPPRNLHYHLARLHGVGLIELVEERPVRGATEKLYRAVAANFSVDANVFSELSGRAREGGLAPLIRRHGEWTLDQLGLALASGSAEPPLSSHQRLRLRAGVAARLRIRLMEWLEECRAADGGVAEQDEPLEDWVLFAVFFRRADDAQ